MEEEAGTCLNLPAVPLSLRRCPTKRLTLAIEAVYPISRISRYICCVMRDKLRKVNPPAKPPRPFGVAPDGSNAALDLSHTALRRDPRGGKGYWCAASSDPRFRSASVKAEVKGSCARVASRRLAPEHRYIPPTSLRRASAQAPGARCIEPPPLRCCDSTELCFARHYPQLQHPLATFLLPFNTRFYPASFSHHPLHEPPPLIPFS